MAIIKAKNGVALLAIGIGLLVTLSACENSKHAEILSTEDLSAQDQTATAPGNETQTEKTETQTESDQAGGTIERQSIDQESLGTSEPLVLAPEPPASPASPAGDQGESGPEVAPPAAVRVLPEAYSEFPRVERSPASNYVPDSPPQAFRDARVREFRVSSLDEPAKETIQDEVPQKTLPTEEPVTGPEMEIAKLEPSDFVPEAPVPELEASRVETVMESELADVFFDFDQYAIRSGAIPVLEKNAALLKRTYKTAGVLIEGHCDERGTGEYNLELGKRRAQAVKEYLVALGVDESGIQIASYGKEKPFCAESTPNCWQNNRRGHFVQRVLHTSLSK